MPDDEFDDGVDDPFDDDEWRPTARIDMTDVRRKLDSMDAEAKTYDMRKAPQVSAELQRRLDASLDDTLEAVTGDDLAATHDDEDIPTMMMVDGPLTVPDAPETREVDLEAAIIKAKRVTADKRALTLPSPTDELPTIEAATQPLRPRPAAGRTMKSAFGGQTSSSAETLVRPDASEEVPTVPRTMVSPLGDPRIDERARAGESERPRRMHGIQRRPIVPARHATLAHLDSEEEIVIMAPPPPAPPSPPPGAPIRPFPQPMAPAVGDAELDALLTEMEVAQRRRNLAGPILLFVVLAIATAGIVYLIN